MSSQQRGPQGRPTSKNPGSESVTSFPEHTCLCGSVCVLGTGFWKLGPVSPGPHPSPTGPSPIAGSASQPLAVMDRSQEDQCAQSCVFSCWNPGWPWGPQPGFVSGDNQSFSLCSRPCGTIKYRFPCSPCLSRLFRGVASILQDLFQAGVFSPHHALFKINYWREGGRCEREPADGPSWGWAWCGQQW